MLSHLDPSPLHAIPSRPITPPAVMHYLKDAVLPCEIIKLGSDQDLRRPQGSTKIHRFLHIDMLRPLVSVQGKLACPEFKGIHCITTQQSIT